MGCQCHVDTEEMTVFCFFFLFFGRGGSFFENKSHTEDDKVQVKRGMLDSKSEATYNSSAGTS